MEGKSGNSAAGRKSLVSAALVDCELLIGAQGVTVKFTGITAVASVAAFDLIVSSA